MNTKTVTIEGVEIELTPEQIKQIEASKKPSPEQYLKVTTLMTQNTQQQLTADNRIRFRAWDSKNNYWWDGSNINVNPYGEIFYKEGNADWRIDGDGRFKIELLAAPPQTPIQEAGEKLDWIVYVPIDESEFDKRLYWVEHFDCSGVGYLKKVKLSELMTNRENSKL